MTARERLWQYRRENGLCINCGRDAVKGRTRCMKCLLKNAEASRARRERYSDEEKERQKENQRRWRENHKKNRRNAV